MYWFFRDLFLIGGGGGVNLPRVYVHCAISAKCGVALFKASMLDWRRGWGQSALGICALCYIYMKHIWCNCFPEIYA